MERQAWCLGRSEGDRLPHSELRAELISLALRVFVALSLPARLARLALPMCTSLSPIAVINTGPTPLCLFTVYAPAEHNEKTVHKTKEEGDKAEDDGKDEAPEWAQKD